MPFSPRRKLPVHGHPEFSATIAFTARGKLARHLKRDHPLPNMDRLKKTDPEAFERELHAFREARSKGERDPKRMWVGMGNEEMESHSDALLQKQLVRTQKERMFEEFKHRVRQLDLSTSERGHLVKDGFVISKSPDFLPPVSLQMLLDLGHSFSTPDELPRSLKGKMSTPHSIYPELGKTLYAAALFELLSQHLEFNHINAAPGQIREGVDLIMRHSPDYDAQLEKWIPQIERKIIAQKRQRQAHEQEYHPHRKAFLKKIQQEIGDYYFPSAVRKKIYREAEQYKIDGKSEADIIHHAENRAFQEAQHYLRSFLQGLGYRPEKLMALLRVKEMNPDSIQTMKRLWVLFRKYKGQPAAQKAFIDRAVRVAVHREKLGTASNGDSNGFTRTKRQKEVRAPKRRPTLEEIKLPKEQAPRTVLPVKPVAELPEVLDKMIELISVSPHVTHEMFVGLKRTMREEAGKKVSERNNGLLFEGCKFWILSYITSRYGFDGRLIEGKLHDIFPRELHNSYKSARDELIRQGFLKYEHHMTSNRHLALTDYAKQMGIGKKFDTNQNSRRAKK